MPRVVLSMRRLIKVFRGHIVGIEYWVMNHWRQFWCIYTWFLRRCFHKCCFTSASPALLTHILHYPRVLPSMPIPFVFSPLPEASTVNCFLNVLSDIAIRMQSGTHTHKCKTNFVTVFTMGILLQNKWTKTQNYCWLFNLLTFDTSPNIFLVFFIKGTYSYIGLFQS